MRTIKKVRIYTVTFLSLLLFLSACAGVVITDSMWCGSLASEGAACFHTLTNDSESMNLQQFAAWWDDLSDPKVATSIATLTDIKADIEKLCSFNNVCTYDMTAQVTALAAKVDKAKQAAQKASDLRIK